MESIDKVLDEVMEGLYKISGLDSKQWIEQEKFFRHLFMWGYLFGQIDGSRSIYQLLIPHLQKTKGSHDALVTAIKMVESMKKDINKHVIS